jgi:hypothetical protein
LPPDFDFEVVAQRESSGGFQAPSTGLGLPLEGVVSEVFASAVSASPAGSNGESVSGRLPPGDLSPVSVWWRGDSSFEPFTRLPLGGVDLAAGLSAPRLERVPVVWGSGLGGRGQPSASVGGVGGPRAALVVEAPGAESFLGRIPGSGLSGRFLRSASLLMSCSELLCLRLTSSRFVPRGKSQFLVCSLPAARPPVGLLQCLACCRWRQSLPRVWQVGGGPRPLPIPPGEGLGWGAGSSSTQPAAGAGIPLSSA